MQGVGYGPRISDAEPFPGVKEFLAGCKAAGVRVAIVSHKTKHPYLGAKHDLHAAAHAFLTAHGFYDTSDTGLSPDVGVPRTHQAGEARPHRRARVRRVRGRPARVPRRAVVPGAARGRSCSTRRTPTRTAPTTPA